MSDFTFGLGMFVIMSETDLQLLTRYTSQRAEDAFTEVVRRHVDLVHSAALRQVRSPELAEEVAQAVFIELARRADQLPSDTVVGAWLYNQTRRRAIDVVRREAGRSLREQTAQELQAMNATAEDWAHIQPLLDDAMDALEETDRVAVLLRYFQNKPLREVGQAMGVTDDAAQKRVSRAVERLREFFAKRGITIGASGLVVVISANAVQAAPAGLIGALATTALAGTTLITTVTKAVVITATQKALVALAITAAVGTGIYEALQASTLRRQVQTLQQQQAPLAEQLTKLQAENERLSKQVVLARDSQTLPKAQLEELIRLRGKSGVARADASELATVKSTLADQTDRLTNATAIGIEMAVKMRMTIAQARLDLMKKTLDLTDDQTRAVRENMQKHARREMEVVQEAMSGKTTPDLRQAMTAERSNQEEEIKSLLTPEQLAAYPQFEQAEKTAAAEKSANYETSQIADEFSLSKEQLEQIRAAFYQMNLHEPARLNPEAIAAAKANGNLAETISQSVELEKSRLEERLKILGGILTPQQLETYREQAMKGINMMATAMKMALPKKPTETEKQP